MAPTARQEYTARRDARTTARDTLSRTDAQVAFARIACVVAALILGALAWRGTLSSWWLLAPALAFLWLVRHHDRVLRARDEAIRGITFYERGLGRMDDRWIGTGEPGDRFRDDNHVYANDLDLFGRGSLFELLSLARTRAGEATLARWLTTATEASEIRARQTAVAELAPALDLREQIALSGADVRASVDTDRLLDWAESPILPRHALRTMIWMATAAVVAGIGYLAVTSVWWPLTALLVLVAVFLHQFREQIDAMLSTREPGLTADFVADPLTHRSRDLDTLADLLTTLERATFQGERLTRLRAALSSDGMPASRIIRQLHRLSEINDSQKNTAALPLALFLYGAYTGRTWMIGLAMALAAALMLIRPHIALAVERWRSRHGRSVRIWIESSAEIEALASLAAYHYEHADDPFPEIVSSGVGAHPATFDGVQLGHPLLPRASMVRNDVHLSGETRLLVVSGSNMSGKSTLLRTVGINAVLALAGAPVRAHSLRLSPLALGATLRIQDSLLEGRSRFYAEITRIRALSEIASGPVPLLFLLDELFHGTNSHDRVLGAEGVLRSLLQRGAIGLITTHDLALTAIADGLPGAVNVHFEDWFEENTIRFDYRMKAGPVTRSNALALMRSVGLDVPV